jgi:hypothetical protein
MNGSWVSQFTLLLLAAGNGSHNALCSNHLPSPSKDKQKNIDPPNSQPISQKLEKTFDARTATWEKKMSAAAITSKEK